MTEEPAPRAPHAPQATQTPAPARGEVPGPGRPPQGHTAAPEQPPGVFQVVMHDVMRDAFERWLTGRGLHLFRMPIDDGEDLPTYGIGINEIGESHA